MSRLDRGAEQIWSLLNSEEDARVCLDIPDAACNEQPRAFTLQLVAKTLSGLADTLSSSRVVLPWLLSTIAAPAAFIAWLVPLRESLSLLPQLVVAARLRRQPLRKGFYAAGALAQGLCLLGMPMTLLLPTPTSSAAAVLVLLGLFSLSRGVCSVAAKDVLGKTVSKKRRGRLTGLAGSAAGLFTVALAAGLLLGGATPAGGAVTPVLVGMLVAGGLCWLVVAFVYRTVPEVPGATEGGGNALDTALESIALLRDDAPFRNFVIARMLLVSAAYLIPYLVVIAQTHGSGATTALAAILLAEGLAALSSSTIWGYWSDLAAQRVMAAAGGLTATVIGATLWLLWSAPHLLGSAPVSATLLFLAAVAHQGVRVGRKTYLVDLATQETRASYVAVSNTVIGVFMLCGGALGWVDARLGTAWVLAALLLMALLAVAGALRLPAAGNPPLGRRGENG